MPNSNQIQFLGHNAWLLTTGGCRVLIDPFLEHNPVCDVAPESVKTDYILVSHGHGDHFGDTVHIAGRTKATVLAIAEIAGYLGDQGISRVRSLNLGGGVTLPFGRVQMTPALHSSTLPDGMPGGSAAGFLISLNSGQNLYFACDTALFSDMSLLAKRSLYAAFLPIGDTFTMGPDDALEAVRLLQPQFAIPCHYNTWKVIAQDPNAWKARVESETSTRVRIMKPEDVWEL